MPLTAGARLGPYEILGLVGSGGMGTVYRARDPRLGRDVAVKVIATDGPPSAKRLRRFEDEARAVASLSHPNVLTVFDVGERGGEPYVVFELLEGETLRERLRFGALPLRLAIEIGVQVCRGLQAAHVRGILHRDLKPENVFLTTDGFVKILDFGLAKLTRGEGAAGEGERTQTAAGVVMGTVGYLSPEQARGQEADARSDIFAVGAILYEALSGRRAFAGATAADTISAILHGEPPPVQTGTGPVPGAVERVVRRCLAKEREDRFHSAHDLALALEAALERPLGTGVEEAEERGPYPGLSSFTEAEAGRFFGREGEVETLWERIRARRLLAVIGPSGAGKTSFVRAGVVASRPEGWAAVVTTPGSSPLLMLGQALAPELQGDVEALRRLVRFEDPDVVFGVLGRWRRGHAQALLVVDQLEELFTLCSPEVQARFATLLGRLAGEGGIHVLLAMRDDFLMRCGEHEALVPVFMELTPLLPMGRDALRRALVEPARREAYRFEDDALVEEMTDAVEGERAALPLLAFAVARLWEKRDRERKVLTRAAHGEIGGVAGALAQHAEATMDRIGPERQATVREVFRNLVTAQGTRAPMDREELLSAFTDRAAAEEVLRQLIDARLLTSYEVAGEEGEPSHHRVEVVHESLLKAWPRLVRWQAQDAEGALLRDQLKQAAHLWEEKGQPADLLWSGTSFREYELWRERYPGQLTAIEEAYAKAMVERARRRRRLRRGAVAAAFLVLAGVSAAIAVSRHQAAKARDQARAEALRAESAKLLALAQVRLADDPTEALAYATASLELADTKEARAFVVRTLWAAPPALEVVTGGRDDRVPAFSPDGRHLAVAGHSAGARVFSEGGQGPVVLPGHETSERGPNVASWAHDDLLVSGLCCSLARYVQTWSIPSGRRVGRIDFGASSNWQNGRSSLLTETAEGPERRRRLLLRAWPLPEGQPTPLGRVDWYTLGASSSAFAPDGTGWLYTKGPAVYSRPLPLVSAVRDHLFDRHASEVTIEVLPNGIVLARDRSAEIRLWSFATHGPERTSVFERPDDAPEAVYPDPSGRWLVGFAWADDRLRLWDVSAPKGARPLVLRRSGSWFASCNDFHPRGDWIVASTNLLSRLTFWPLRRRYPIVIGGYAQANRPVAFSPDGRWLATSWADNVLRLWPLPGGEGRAPRLLPLPGPQAALWRRLVFDPKDRYLFAVGNDDYAWIVPLDGSPARKLPAFSNETAVFAADVSPSGRYVAWAFGFAGGAKTLRLWDTENARLRLFDLPKAARAAVAGRDGALPTGYEDGVTTLGFTDETTLYTAGDGGLRRWNLETGSQELEWPASIGSDFGIAPSGNRRSALSVEFDADRRCSALRLHDLFARTSRPLPAFGCGVPLALDATGAVAAVGDGQGTMRVGRVGGGEPHLLAGHDGPIEAVAISPDLRWVATTGQDNTLRLWPMPDLSSTPLHTLPRDALIAELHTLTNLRAVRDPTSSAGWKIDLAPFPGWKDVPAW
jgi:WD40 repeat protein